MQLLLLSQELKLVGNYLALTAGKLKLIAYVLGPILGTLLLCACCRSLCGWMRPPAVYYNAEGFLVDNCITRKTNWVGRLWTPLPVTTSDKFWHFSNNFFGENFSFIFSSVNLTIFIFLGKKIHFQYQKIEIYKKKPLFCIS